ncbi:MAG: hypothetical protein IKU30_03415 [Clostridia bacterium]|nr:hypothetical protein [Clostridia bacterium]
MAKRTIRYSEPDDYFPKEIRDKYFGDALRKAAGKKTASTKKTSTKKK